MFVRDVYANFTLEKSTSGMHTASEPSKLENFVSPGKVKCLSLFSPLIINVEFFIHEYTLYTVAVSLLRGSKERC
jgi:hypothetical protein